MFPQTSRRYLAAAIVFLVAIAIVTTGVFTGHGSSQGNGTLPQEPSGRFASQLVHYTMTEYVNYDVRGSDLPRDVQLAQTKLITERWVQLDANGNLSRVKNVTRLESGELWQERLYGDGREIVNWYRYPGSGATCSQTANMTEQPGSTLPFASDDQLRDAGFKQTDRASDLVQAGAPNGAQSFEYVLQVSPVKGMVSGRSVTIRDPHSQQRVADLFYGVDAAGSEVLLQSTTFSPVSIAGSESGAIFVIAPLPAGCGRPS